MLGDILLVPKLALHALTPSICLGANQQGQSRACGDGDRNRDGDGGGYGDGDGDADRDGDGGEKGGGDEDGESPEHPVLHRAARSLFAPGEGIPCMAPNEQQQGCRRAPAALEVSYSYRTAHLCC